jgi:putative oxidoreductase
MPFKRSSTVSLARLEPIAFAALRIVAGSAFFFHGAQKLLGWFATRAGPAVGSQLWVGGLVELTCGALIAVGLFTRPAAFLASGTMAVAYTQFHWKLAMDGGKFLPIVNQGELALIYCFLFFFVFAHGPGAVSLDAVRSKR